MVKNGVGVGAQCADDTQSKNQATSLPDRAKPSRVACPKPQQLGLQSVPKVMHFPRALTEGEGGRYETDPSQHMMMAGKSTAEEMARFVKDRTGASISIVRWVSTVDVANKLWW